MASGYSIDRALIQSAGRSGGATPAGGGGSGGGGGGEREEGGGGGGTASILELFSSQLPVVHLWGHEQWHLDRAYSALAALGVAEAVPRGWTSPITLSAVVCVRLCVCVRGGWQSPMTLSAVRTAMEATPYKHHI